MSRTPPLPILLVGLLATACGRPADSTPGAPAAGRVNISPGSTSTAAADEESRRLAAAAAKACEQKDAIEIAMQTLAGEIAQSKTRRGAGPTDPLTEEEARILADMKVLVEKARRCAEATERQVAHGTAVQRRAVHDYVDALKSEASPKDR